MKNWDNYAGSFLLAILLIITGAIFPSNGIDDSIEKSPTQMLLTARNLLIIFVSFYLLFHFLYVRHRKRN